MAASHIGVILSVVVVVEMGCAGKTGPLVLPDVAPPRGVERTHQSTACDAFFAIGGSFVFGRNDLRLVLSNTSSDAQCVAPRVQWLFAGPIRTAEMTVTSPPSWTTHELPCAEGPATCGVEWQATDTGVLPGQELSGFGLRYNPLNTPRPRSWVVHVGERRVEMPIGVMGSRLGPVEN